MLGSDPILESVIGGVRRGHGMFRTGGVETRRPQLRTEPSIPELPPLPSAASPKPAANGWHTARTPYSQPPEPARCTPAHPDAAGYQLAPGLKRSWYRFLSRESSWSIGCLLGAGTAHLPGRDLRCISPYSVRHSLATLRLRRLRCSEIPPVRSTCG